MTSNIEQMDVNSLENEPKAGVSAWAPAPADGKTPEGEFADLAGIPVEVPKTSELKVCGAFVTDKDISLRIDSIVAYRPMKGGGTAVWLAGQEGPFICTEWDTKSLELILSHAHKRSQMAETNED